MIPAIGLMIGVYIIVKMLSFILRLGTIEENMVVKIFAGIAILITIYCIYALFTSSSSIGY